jgi:predicted PurR-regulated permease PerM
MHKKNVITYLIIFNLLAVLIILLGKISILKNFISVVFAVVIVPIIFGVFLFYILKPLNNIFIKKKIEGGKAAALTLLIFFFIASGLAKYFGDYFIEQFTNLKSIFLTIIKYRGIDDGIRDIFNESLFKLDYYNKFLFDIQKYSILLVTILRGAFDKGMQLFSNILLVVLIVFYLLRDEKEIKENIVNIFPRKYKNKINCIIKEGDEVLSSYILGQAKVAFSLALMVYIGYKIIGMATPLLLASFTFVLAFIPFVGFFISMIIPFIIAIALGWNMIIKLSILIVIAQTLKGRFIVPLIMGKTMKIHPITDIFLVVGAASLVGPIGAFVVVPTYALLKVVFKYFDEELEEKLREFKE